MTSCTALWHKPQHLVLPTTIHVVFRAGIRPLDQNAKSQLLRGPLCVTPRTTATAHSHVAALAVPCYRTMKRHNSAEEQSAQSTGSASLLNEVSLLYDDCFSAPT
jgi:hypothetical protein